MFEYPLGWRGGESVQYTCSCNSTQYSPTFIPDQYNMKVYFCSSCGCYLSTSQIDHYFESLAYDCRVAEIEEQRERRKNIARNGEKIYDEVI
jgi:hypothetical protein